MGILLTVPELASEFRVAEETVRSMARRGDIAAIRIGRGSRSGYRFTREAVDTYLAQQSDHSRRRAG